MLIFETKEEAFSRGFDRGNYAAAYESQDWDSWYADNCTAHMDDEFRDAYHAGTLLGFHSSLEIHEIGDPDLAEAVEDLRRKWGED